MAMESHENSRRLLISVSGFVGSGSMDVSEWIAENIGSPFETEIVYIKNLPHDERKLSAMGNNVSEIKKEGKITVINMGPRTTYTVDSNEATLKEIIESYPSQNKLFVLDGFQNIAVASCRIFRILVVKNIREIEHFSSAFTPDMVVLHGDTAIHDETIIKWPEGKKSIIYGIKTNFLNEKASRSQNFSTKPELKLNSQTRENIL